MKHLLLVSLISLAATPFGFAQTAAAADTKTAEQEVRQMIEQYRNALTKKDTAALERIWADDYTFINASGVGCDQGGAPGQPEIGCYQPRYHCYGPRHENPGLRWRCRGRDQSGHVERAVQRQSHQRPIPSQHRLGKNANRLATGLQPDYSGHFAIGAARGHSVSSLTG